MKNPIDRMEFLSRLPAFALIGVCVALIIFILGLFLYGLAVEISE